MKKLTLLFITFLIFNLSFIISYAQAPNYLWAKSAGGTSDDEAFSVAVDASGNSYVTGYFSSATISFGSTTLTNAGSADIFLAKYDANGNVLWAKSAGGTGDDEANSVAVDASGNCYVTGYFFSPTISFGSTTLTNAGGYDIFLAKYDATGNVLWAKSVGGISDEQATSVAVDASGNTYMAGLFTSTTLVFGSTTLTDSGTGYSSDIFLSKYDSNGNVIWAKSAGGTSDDKTLSVAVDVSGNSYVTGWFSSSTLNFGSTSLANTGNYEMFLAKYDASGNVLWAKKPVGSGTDYGNSIAVDVSGNSYVSGFFQGNTITFGSTILTNAGGGGTDIFLAKYNTTGNLLWAKSAGGIGHDYASSVAVDTTGNCYVAGFFMDAAIPFGSTILPHVGASDIFIAKYDTTGNVLWAKSAGGTGSDWGSSVAVDVFGNSYVSGYFRSPTISFGSTTLTDVGGYDIFLEKLASFSVTVTSTKHIPCDTCVKLTANVTGGTAPYTYQWYINSQLYNTGQIINYCNKYPFTFSSDSLQIIVTDANSQQATYFNGVPNLLSSTIPLGYQICIATVDSAIGKNLLVWNQTTDPSVVSYNIYKQNTSSVFAVIANVPRSSFSTFIDTSSKPAQVSAMYNMSMIDSCGFESSWLSTIAVSTIHLAISAGIFPAWNLAWNSTQGYSIVKYRIWRATTLNNPVLIDSVANSIYAYTDLTPPAGVLYYTIEAVSTAACSPSLRTENINSAYSSSFSNVRSTNATGINEYYLDNNISVFPNPVADKIYVKQLANSQDEMEICLVDIIGAQVSEKIKSKSSKITIDVSGLKKGFYFLQVKTNKGIFASKIIVQR